MVLHGSSSVPAEFVAKCNQYGGQLPNAQGVPEDMLNYASKHGVAKINIDTDLRLAMTSTIREFFVEHPENLIHVNTWDLAELLLKKWLNTKWLTFLVLQDMLKTSNML